MDCADVDDALTAVTRDKEVNGSKEEDWRKRVSFPKISLHGNSMEKYVFCDNIIFNNMPIYTRLICILYCLLLNLISFFFITFDCIIAPPGGHLVL